ncbi:MAG: formylglycine-generating enzyme family protein [Bradymonadia bacterium]
MHTTPPQPAWAEHITDDDCGQRATFMVDGELYAMRWIPPGQFMMGSPLKEKNRHHTETLHEVILTSGFWMGETTVTQSQWVALMGDNPSRAKDPQCPVDTLSWDDCHRFLDRLNSSAPGLEARMPTEAQWEYACRAGTATLYWCGHTVKALKTTAWFMRNCRGIAHPVGLKEANPWGLYDMHGNVKEWCHDFFEDYPEGIVTDPTGPTQGYSRVLRGGCWMGEPHEVRSASRKGYGADDPGFGDRGLRLVTPA